VKKIGFLSFGHWSQSPSSQVRSASDALIQSLELAVAAEEVGADGAYYRVHHFARQLGSPFPLLAAVGARTSRIEIGTAVVDMRYENPFYMAEDAGAADLLAGTRARGGYPGMTAELPKSGPADGADRGSARSFCQI
jgi:alkanesulfonate monooxygenase SsuD/methylene tetrahydromethanopterin reductase-like flavin-dependent oxidoreductase (luciferase family)